MLTQQKRELKWMNLFSALWKEKWKIQTIRSVKLKNRIQSKITLVFDLQTFSNGIGVHLKICLRNCTSDWIEEKKESYQSMKLLLGMHSKTGWFWFCPVRRLLEIHWAVWKLTVVDWLSFFSLFDRNSFAFYCLH